MLSIKADKNSQYQTIKYSINFYCFRLDYKVVELRAG